MVVNDIHDAGLVVNDIHDAVGSLMIFISSDVFVLPYLPHTF